MDKPSAKPNVGAIIKGSNFLAVNLHKTLARNGENVFFSPLSLSSAMAMLLYGLRSDAASEVRQILGYEDINNEVLLVTFKEIISSLNKSQEGYTISYANSVVIGNNFKVYDQYTSDLNTYFNALHLQGDFGNNADAAVKQINDWVSEKTNSMIPKLLAKLNSNTVMVLLNAVYFKGLWLNQFEKKSTRMQHFYNGGVDHKKKLVEMMHLKEKFPFVQKKSFKALQLPYRGEEIAMLVLLPTARDGLKDMEDMLTATFISEIQKDMCKVKVQVALPKFRLEYSEDFKETCKKLGVKEIFKEGADMGGISSSKLLFVSKIIHKAVLEVNEEGSEAAAATAVVVAVRSVARIVEFIVDHPFAFVIYNTKNDLVLFSGRVVELPGSKTTEDGGSQGLIARAADSAKNLFKKK